jgi:translation elongation factor EF-Tu-like GTPase
MTYDAVIVSAADGPLPETVEQLKALRTQGATTVDIVITNTDLVDDAELLELVELEIRDLAQQNGLAVGSITRGPSGHTGGSSIYGPPS